MIMSARYAAELGLTVYADRSHRELVQFIDGSRVLTDGLVKGVEWRFPFARNWHTTKYDFHILNTLSPAFDAIVSNTFIDYHNVFTAYKDCIYEDIQDDDGIYNIRLVKKRRKKRRADIRSLESHYLHDSKFKTCPCPT